MNPDVLRACLCGCGQTWKEPEDAMLWLDHIRSPEYAVAIKTPESQERIRAHWEKKEAETLERQRLIEGMLW